MHVRLLAELGSRRPHLAYRRALIAPLSVPVLRQQLHHGMSDQQILAAGTTSSPGSSAERPGPSVDVVAEQAVGQAVQQRLPDASIIFAPTPTVTQDDAPSRWSR